MLITYLYQRARKARWSWVPSKMGRPPKGEESRLSKINTRVSSIEVQKVQKCADALGITRTDALMRRIDLLPAELEKK